MIDENILVIIKCYVMAFLTFPPFMTVTTMENLNPFLSNFDLDMMGTLFLIDKEFLFLAEGFLFLDNGFQCFDNGIQPFDKAV